MSPWHIRLTFRSPPPPSERVAPAWVTPGLLRSLSKPQTPHFATSKRVGRVATRRGRKWPRMLDGPAGPCRRPLFAEKRPRRLVRAKWNALVFRGPRSGPGVAHAGAPAWRGLGGAARSKVARASSEGSAGLETSRPPTVVWTAPINRTLQACGLQGLLGARERNHQPLPKPPRTRRSPFHDPPFPQPAPSPPHRRTPLAKSPP